MSTIDQWAFSCMNGMAGHFEWLDSAFGLALANDLIKSAIIGACFVAAWHQHQHQHLAETIYRRRTLLITLAASLLTLATTTLISQVVLQPRPYLQAHTIYQLQDDQLVKVTHLNFRQPLGSRAQERERAYEIGNIPPGDLSSFPSDHAGFFVSISLGVWLTSKRIGILALAWTFLVILSGKVITGMHSPLDVSIGCLLAVLWLIACHCVARTALKNTTDRIAIWTTHNGSLAIGVLFVTLFEVVSTFEHVKALAAGVAKRI